MKKVRINITIDEDLSEWIRDYAKENRTTVSTIVNQYFFNLKKEATLMLDKNNVINFITGHTVSVDARGGMEIDGTEYNTIVRFETYCEDGGEQDIIFTVFANGEEVFSERFTVDEDFPREISEVLHNRGYEDVDEVVTGALRVLAKRG